MVLLYKYIVIGLCRLKPLSWSQTQIRAHCPSLVGLQISGSIYKVCFGSGLLVMKVGNKWMKIKYFVFWLKILFRVNYTYFFEVVCNCSLVFEKLNKPSSSLSSLQKKKKKKIPLNGNTYFSCLVKKTHYIVTIDIH